jgi:hypothetical protein
MNAVSSHAPLSASGSVNRRPVACPRVVMDLEALLAWALRTQKAGRGEAALHEIEARVDGRALHHSSRDGVWTMIRRNSLGCRIDCGGPVSNAAPLVHPDASAIATAVNAIPGERNRSLVWRYGQAGERPEWLSLTPRFSPVRVAEDKPGRRRYAVAGHWEPCSRIELRPKDADALQTRGGRGEIARKEGGVPWRYLVSAAPPRHELNHPDGEAAEHVLGDHVWSECCPVVLSPSLAEIRAVNNVYTQWHAGMMHLLGTLMTTGLRERRVSGFKAPARPWE